MVDIQAIGQKLLDDLSNDIKKLEKDVTYNEGAKAGVSEYYKRIQDAATAASKQLGGEASAAEPADSAAEQDAGAAGSGAGAGSTPVN